MATPDASPAAPETATGPSTPPVDRWPDRDATPGDPAHTNAIYRGIVRWGATLVRAYYRFELRGHAFPTEAPVLLIQNHNNGLCDAHSVMAATGRPIRILVKYTLMKTPVIGWMLRQMHAVPMYRQKDNVDTRQNASSFDAIDQALQEGSVIALFPEGESLDAVGLREMRSGVARMAMSAEDSRDHQLGLLIVPMGVTFERRDRYRTEVSCVLGEPFPAAPVLEPLKERSLREQTRALMGPIRSSLQALVLDAKDEEEFRASIALERIGPTTVVPLGLRRKTAQDALARDLERDPDGAPERRRIVTELGEALESGRLRGDDVLAEKPGLLATFVPLLWLAPLFALGLVPYGYTIPATVFTSRFRKTPDKKVTLRVVLGFFHWAGWLAVCLLLAAWFGGLWAALGCLALFAVYVPLWPRVMDGLIEVKRRYLRRALERRPDEFATLVRNVRSIRAAFPDLGKAPRDTAGDGSDVAG